MHFLYLGFNFKTSPKLYIFKKMQRFIRPENICDFLRDTNNIYLFKEEFFLNKDKNTNKLLTSALFMFGDLSLIEICESFIQDFNGLTKYVVASKNENVVKYYIKKISEAFDSESISEEIKKKNFDDGLYHSARYGFVDMFSLFEKEGANDYEKAFLGSCKSNNIALVKHIIKILLDDGKKIDYILGLQMANRSIDVFSYLLLNYFCDSDVKKINEKTLQRLLFKIDNKCLILLCEKFKNDQKKIDQMYSIIHSNCIIKQNLVRDLKTILNYQPSKDLVSQLSNAFIKNYYISESSGKKNDKPIYNVYKEFLNLSVLDDVGLTFLGLKKLFLFKVFN